jgi:hypothetical protein
VVTKGREKEYYDSEGEFLGVGWEIEEEKKMCEPCRDKAVIKSIPVKDLEKETPGDRIQ